MTSVTFITLSLLRFWLLFGAKTAVLLSVSLHEEGRNDFLSILWQTLQFYSSTPKAHGLFAYHAIRHEFLPNTTQNSQFKLIFFGNDHSY